jgi:hypothetical protein
LDKWNRFLKFFYAPRGVTIPRLATRALPEMALGLKAAGGAAVACEGFDGMVKGALHLGVKLFVF